MSDKRIKYKDLSVWLKIAIVGGYGFLIVYGISFLVGFIIGVTGA